MKTYCFSDGQFIKIGKTRGSVQRRLKQVQSGMPNTLVVLFVLDGDFEQQYHKHLKQYRVRGEWFSIDALERLAELPAASFWIWLDRQKEREDFVGDVARDAATDRCFPRRTNDYQRMKLHISWSHHTCREAQIGLAKGYREWTLLRREEGLPGLYVPFLRWARSNPYRGGKGRVTEVTTVTR